MFSILIQSLFYCSSIPISGSAYFQLKVGSVSLAVKHMIGICGDTKFRFSVIYRQLLLKESEE